MNRSFHIRQFCPIYGNRNTTIRYIFQVSCFYYAPLLLLTATVCLCVYLHLAGWSYVSKMTLLCFLLFLEYLICGIAGIILTFKKKENPKNDIDY